MTYRISETSAELPTGRAAWRSGEQYVVRDTDGRIITADEGRQIVHEHHKVDNKRRARLVGGCAATKAGFLPEFKVAGSAQSRSA